MCIYSNGQTDLLSSGNTRACFAFAIRHGSHRIFQAMIGSKLETGPGATLGTWIICSTFRGPNLPWQPIKDSECRLSIMNPLHIKQAIFSLSLLGIFCRWTIKFEQVKSILSVGSDNVFVCARIEHDKFPCFVFDGTGKLYVKHLT